ncbi:transposase [Acetobacter tropicalis]|uniref:transposase n=1 Tax=Acetobacter TaxID=434 RepID=UPI0009DB5ABA
MIDRLTDRGITTLTPLKRNRTIQPKTDFVLYLERNSIEFFFNKFKEFHSISTYYNKLKSTFLVAVQLTLLFIPLN